MDHENLFQLLAAKILLKGKILSFSRPISKIRLKILWIDLKFLKTAFLLGYLLVKYTRMCQERSAVIAALLGAVGGFFLARKYMQDYFKKNPPINEDMLRQMMMSMGQKPSEKKVRQMMQQMKNQQ